LGQEMRVVDIAAEGDCRAAFLPPLADDERVERQARVYLQ